MRFLADFFRSDADVKRTRGSDDAGAKADTRFRAVGIRPADESCEAARQFGNMRFLCAKAPRLPLPECTAATCNCRYVHFSDRRTGLDRRATYDWTRERELGVVNRRLSHGRRSTDAIG